MKQSLRRWLPPLVWMGLIFIVSAQPTLPSAPSGWDAVLKKTMHVVAYGVLAWLYARAMRGRRVDGAANRQPDEAKIRAISAGLAVVYALSDEYHQMFVPGRNGSLVDVGVDGLGVAGFILWDCWRPMRRTSQSEFPRREQTDGPRSDPA